MAVVSSHCEVKMKVQSIFQDLCLSRVCSIIPQQPKERCPVVQTYINLCAREGLVVSVSSPAFVKDCGMVYESSLLVYVHGSTEGDVAKIIFC